MPTYLSCKVYPANGTIEIDGKVRPVIYSGESGAKVIEIGYCLEDPAAVLVKVFATHRIFSYGALHSTWSETDFLSKYKEIPDEQAGRGRAHDEGGLIILPRAAPRGTTITGSFADLDLRAAKAELGLPRDPIETRAMFYHLTAKSMEFCDGFGMEDYLEGRDALDDIRATDTPEAAMGRIVGDGLDALLEADPDGDEDAEGRIDHAYARASFMGLDEGEMARYERRIEQLLEVAKVALGVENPTIRFLKELKGR